ncbi:MAG TPA: hypothetical protein VGR66_02565 [Candidatus Eisenbacteria bacterium]|jgi:hypothetical protein|nr:hypothetical protein [Candidatus Eisenbacteria bacterium]
MGRLATVVFLSLLVFAGSARATGNPRPSAGVTVPAEWAGIWTSVDSVYDCATGSLLKVVELTDTLCAGEDVPDDPNAPSYFVFNTCTGSADATHIQEQCTANGGLCGEACTVADTLDVDATRQSDFAFWSWTTRAVSTCHVSICDFCMLTHRRSLRIAPGPCGVVPTQVESWGKLKAHYH